MNSGRIWSRKTVVAILAAVGLLTTAVNSVADTPPELGFGHLRGNRYDVSLREMRDMAAVKARLGVPTTLASCHTALVSGYVIEGHVPAAAVHRLLKEKRRIAGLAVPGMPPGPPGMEGTRRDPYDILAFDRLGVVTVYETVRPAFVSG